VHLEVIHGALELGWCGWLNLVISYRRSDTRPEGRKRTGRGRPTEARESSPPTRASALSATAAEAASVLQAGGFRRMPRGSAPKQRPASDLACSLHFCGIRRHALTHLRRLITRRSQVQILPPLLDEARNAGLFFAAEPVGTEPGTTFGQLLFLVDTTA
jgi:hypothetical protein